MRSVTTARATTRPPSNPVKDVPTRTPSQASARNGINTAVPSSPGCSASASMSVGAPVCRVASSLSILQFSRYSASPEIGVCRPSSSVERRRTLIRKPPWRSTFSLNSSRVTRSQTPARPSPASRPPWRSPLPHRRASRATHRRTPLLRVYLPSIGRSGRSLRNGRRSITFADKVLWSVQCRPARGACRIRYGAVTD